MRRLVASVFLASQLAAVVYAQFTPRRYFCWAPNDYVTEFNLSVSINGRALTPRQALARYSLPGPLFENVPSHLIDIVQQYEETYGKGDHARVEVAWVLNGKGAVERWHWPSP